MSDTYTPRRRRGGDAPDLATLAGDADAGIRAAGLATAGATDATPRRERRQRFGTGGFKTKLALPSEMQARLKQQGLSARWVNDDGNRIAELRELGYEFVTEQGVQTDGPGSRVSRLVGTKANGEPLHAYLMDTPDELIAQGAVEKEAHNRQIDEAIRAGRDSTDRLSPHESYGHGSISVER